MANAIETLIKISNEMRRESNEDMPKSHMGYPTIYADIDKWAKEIELIIRSPQICDKCRQADI